MADKKNSERLSDFLRFVSEAETRLVSEREAVGRCDKATTDMLHQLELTPMSYHELAKWAKELKQVRLDRRKAKDAVETYEPIVKFAEENQGLKRKLPQVLGEVRRVENYHGCRTYKPRVLK